MRITSLFHFFVSLFLMADTIAAIITPLGRSSVGAVRLSGENSLEILKKLVRDENFQPRPRFAYLKKIYGFGDAEVLDETVVTYFQTPHSFTGENVVEISSHGSPVILRQIIDCCLHFDARMAEAGEFSLRALSNGKMNLSQAEAVRDLIDAQTVAAARQSIRQLRGEFSNQLRPINDELLDIIVILESALEFVEDDLPDFQVELIGQKLKAISREIGRIASTFQAGKLIREGLKVTLIGKPNVGKSSLFNALVGSERAIVTDLPGTTRDQIHEQFTIRDIPVSLIDTAGMRETNDLVESIGVERSRRILADADLNIIILDGSQPLTFEDEAILSQIENLNHIIAFNKSDLGLTDANFDGANVLHISAKNGDGLEQLKQMIVEPFSASIDENAGFVIADARHFDLLKRAQTEIENSAQLFSQSVSEEIVLIGLHNSLNYLGQITGETTTEDMLTQIFSTFCIGK